MRPISREYDEHEHDAADGVGRLVSGSEGRDGGAGEQRDGAGDGFVQVCVQAEELCWGDAGLYLRMPTPALGGAAVAAAGTPEQKERFLAPLPRDGQPNWGAMAITEPGAGSRLGRDPDDRARSTATSGC